MSRTMCVTLLWHTASMAGLRIGMLPKDCCVLGIGDWRKRTSPLACCARGSLLGQQCKLLAYEFRPDLTVTWLQYIGQAAIKNAAFKQSDDH